MSSDSFHDQKLSELEHLQAEGIRVFRSERPKHLPLMFFIKTIGDWIEERLIEEIRENGFPEARQAFNPVFIHLPADGCRLTELARRAEMTKQSMSELVEELVDMGYLARFPDPKDRRAKIIVRTKPGLELHYITMAAFAQIDRELAGALGDEAAQAFREAAAQTTKAVQALRDTTS